MKNGIGIAVVAAFALSAHGFTTNVSTVTELAGALQYMNERYHTGSHSIVLKTGQYDVTDLNLQYFNSSSSYNRMIDSGANFGISYFVLRGETDNPKAGASTSSVASRQLPPRREAEKEGIFYGNDHHNRRGGIGNDGCADRGRGAGAACHPA